MMNNQLLPTNNNELILAIAKSMSRERLFHDADITVKQVSGYSIKDDPTLLGRLEEEFEEFWKGTLPVDAEMKKRSCSDAVSAINAINLYLLTTDE